ncbi:uncharacterized protein LOC125423080 [Ziziphus jujuba]|uniref:Uncharacterized protein LOC125423080 n=1 Tax=Ziziphus jujuba TaxID=326968 RepID=A0ABM3INV6_ZIZJJ|nr:uncharacterized protein LOC125423080 [Ziziphus jujuba]
MLKGKGKLSHLMGTGPKLGYPKFDAWGEEDSIIMAWLWNSMVPEISDMCMFLATTKDIWDAIQQTYSKARDAGQVYEVKVKTMAAKQSSKTVTEYANQWKSLWQELDHYRMIKTKCSEDAAVLKDFIKQDRVYDFLMGLNPEFDQVRIQILDKQVVSCFNEVAALVRGEERKRGLMLESQITDSSAMVARGENNSTINMDKSLFLESGQPGQLKIPDRDSLWCTYCMKARHSCKRCWKLHGKPSSQEWRHKIRNNGQVHIAKTQQNKAAPKESNGLNQEEVERLRSLIRNLDKPSG